MNEYRLTSDNLTDSLHRLHTIVNTVPSRLKSLSENDFSLPPAPGKWSAKQIIGHLIDSATNNHHRFVRAQFDEYPVILYDQEKWNLHSHYAEMEGHHLISFWEMYNRHLIELIKRLPDDMMEKECRMSDGKLYSIRWLFEDYVRHLEHHLDQINRIPGKSKVIKI